MGRAEHLKELRKETRAIISPTMEGIIRTIDAQATAIAKLSADIQEALAEHKSMIEELRRSVFELELEQRAARRSPFDKSPVE